MPSHHRASDVPLDRRCVWWSLQCDHHCNVAVAVYLLSIYSLAKKLTGLDRGYGTAALWHDGMEAQRGGGTGESATCEDAKAEHNNATVLPMRASMLKRQVSEMIIHSLMSAFPLGRFLKKSFPRSTEQHQRRPLSEIQSFHLHLILRSTVHI